MTCIDRWILIFCFTTLVTVIVGIGLFLRWDHFHGPKATKSEVVKNEPRRVLFVNIDEMERYLALKAMGLGWRSWWGSYNPVLWRMFESYFDLKDWISPPKTHLTVERIHGGIM